MIGGRIFLISVLGHLLGDFVLQTEKIAEQKSSSKKALLIHGGIITLVQVFLLSFYGILGIWVGLVSGFLHLGVDLLKTYISKGKLLSEFFLYIIDQFVHLLILLLVILIFLKNKDPWFLDIGYVKIIIGIILLTFVSTVTIKILIRDVQPKLKEAKLFYNYERLIDGGFSLILCGLIFLPIYYSIALSIFSFYFYQRIQKLYAYSIAIITLKYFCFLLISFIVNFYLMR
ncbi:MAG: hypothetical protein JM58_07715 [Peptococcaceae bacterium BICA1-8]|nr:MAG: hypothetical protein JM58_07715 [Peptococcaceae bacterium BICA1-8]